MAPFWQTSHLRKAKEIALKDSTKTLQCKVLALQGERFWLQNLHTRHLAPQKIFQIYTFTGPKYPDSM